MKLPKCMAKPTGLVAEIALYNYQNMIIPNRTVAYMSAITTISVLMGGRYRGLDGTMAGLCITYIGKTGSGKNSAYNLPDKVFEALAAYKGKKDDSLHLLTYCSTGKISTREGIEDKLKAMNKRPDLIFPIDEMGRFIQDSRRMNNTKAKDLVTLIMDSYGDSKIQLRSLAKPKAEDSGSDPRAIYFPTINVVGATTKSTLMDGITTEQLYDGFMNRFLWFEIDLWETKMTRGFKETPPEKSTLKKLYRIAHIKMGGADPAIWRAENPTYVKFSHEADEYIYDLDDSIRNGNMNEKDRAFYIRTALQLKKIAMVFAVADNPEKPQVTLTMAKDAHGIIVHSNQTILDTCTENLVEDKMKRILTNMKEWLDKNTSKKTATTRASMYALSDFNNCQKGLTGFSRTDVFKEFMLQYEEEYEIHSQILNAKAKKPTEIIYKKNCFSSITRVKVHAIKKETPATVFKTHLFTTME